MEKFGGMDCTWSNKFTKSNSKLEETKAEGVEM